MTDHSFAAVNGIALRTARIVIGNTGPWHAVLDLESDDAIGPAATITVGALTLRGTVDDRYVGTYAAVRKCRVVGGGGGWGRVLKSRGYHNDAGVKARLVAEDAARDAGETLGDFVPITERLGLDYARQQVTAAATLEDATGGAPWWVDYAGTTHVGPRADAASDAGGYQLVAYDPRSRIATLALDDLTALGIGSLVTVPDGTRVVRSLELRIDPDEVRAVAWLGGTAAAPDRLAGLMRTIARRATDDRVWGVWRYRVIRMAADGQRVDLQAVNPDAGLPDLAPIAIWPGVASAHATLSPGSEVLVQFIEGDRGAPVVTHVAPQGSTGWVPTVVTLGGDAGAPAARQGDAVEVYLPSPATFSGTMGGSQVSGIIVWPTGKTVGVITGGSSRVRVAT